MEVLIVYMKFYNFIGADKNKLIKISFKCKDDFPIQNFLHCKGYSIHSIEQTDYPLFDIVITLI